MMISPETYYRESLMGKSPERILQEIHSLKREIRRLEQMMKSDPTNPELMMIPSPMTQIICNRAYLKKAKEAYAATGRRNEPTENELNDEDYNSDCPTSEK